MTRPNAAADPVPEKTGKTVLLADDDASIRTVLSQALTREGFRVRATAAASALWRWTSAGEGDLVITDVFLEDDNMFDFLPRIRAARPDLPVIVVSAQNNVLTAAAAIEHGAFDYLPKPFDLDQLLQTALRAAVKNNAARADKSLNLPMIGRSNAMQEVYRLIARVMNAELTVLIQGEPGAGKQLAARLLHDLSKRRGRPFVTFNAAAFAPAEAEAALFGTRENGGGALAEAGGGTLYLPSVEAMPINVQTRLLAWMSERERQNAALNLREASPRLVADCDGDLAMAAASGAFRSDLYWRLNVVTLTLPPLRARREDIADLARFFLQRAGEQGLADKSFEPAALAALARHAWPGNVRELENVVLRLAALAPERRISAESVQKALGAGTSSDQTRESGDGDRLEPAFAEALARHLGTRLDEALRSEGSSSDLYETVIAAVERPLLRLLLARTNGNKMRAAQALGLNRNTLRTKLAALGLESEPNDR